MKVFQSKVVDEEPKEQPDEQRPMEGAEVDQENKLVKWKGYPSEDITCNLSSAQAAIKAMEERQLEGPGKLNKILTYSAESEPGTEAMDEAVVVDTASAQLPSDAAGKPSNDAAGVAGPRARMPRQDWTEGEKEQLVGLVREKGPGSWDDKALQLGTGESSTRLFCRFVRFLRFVRLGRACLSYLALCEWAVVTGHRPEGHLAVSDAEGSR